MPASKSAKPEQKSPAVSASKAKTAAAVVKAEEAAKPKAPTRTAKPVAEKAPAPAKTATKTATGAKTATAAKTAAASPAAAKAATKPAAEAKKPAPAKRAAKGAASAAAPAGDDLDMSDIEADLAGEPEAATAGGEKVKPLRMKISKAKERALMKEFGLDETVLSEEDMAKRRVPSHTSVGGFYFME